MTLLSRLVNRPAVAANISSPAFYRAIDELRPTLLIDEADTLLPGNAQLRGILNSGYSRKLAYVLRVTNESPSAEGEVSNQDEGEIKSTPHPGPLPVRGGEGERRTKRRSRLA